METSYTDPLRGLHRLIYLRDKVFPHLDKMPTIEDYTDHMRVNGLDGEDRNMYDADPEVEFWCNDSASGRKLLQGKAVLDFNVYCATNTPLGFDQIPPTDEYNCSRQGCLAGWYVFLRDEDTRVGKPNLDFSDLARTRIGTYSAEALAHHFQIGGGESQMLFGSLLKGAEGLPDELDYEDTIWSTSQLNVTKLALEARRAYLDQIIEQKEEWIKSLAAPAGA